MPVIAIVADLLFQAKIRSAAAAAGVDASFPRTADAVDRAIADVEHPLTVLVDLNTRWLDPVDFIGRVRRAADDRATIVAFGFHDDPEKLERARAAGADRAIPRSAFVKELGSLFG